jgi:hypothetical protein
MNSYSISLYEGLRRIETEEKEFISVTTYLLAFNLEHRLSNSWSHRKFWSTSGTYYILLIYYSILTIASHVNAAGSV